LNPSDFAQNRPDLDILGLEITNDFIDTLQVLVSVDVFWHGLPLSLHKGKHLLFMLNVGNSLLQLFF
jgi:hypothetical protein